MRALYLTSLFVGVYVWLALDALSSGLAALGVR